MDWPGLSETSCDVFCTSQLRIDAMRANAAWAWSALWTKNDWPPDRCAIPPSSAGGASAKPRVKIGIPAAAMGWSAV